MVEVVMAKSAEAEKGFFTMETVHAIMACNLIDDAKHIARLAVEAKTRARPENRMKALRMIDEAKSILKLGDDICRGFILAHMGMKIIK